MFKILKELNKRVKTLDQDKAMKKILSRSELKKKIIKLNQEQLYEKGIDSEGEPTGDYADSTIYGVPGRFPGKIDKGQRYDHITLKDSGEFYKSMEIVSEPDAIVFEADDLKVSEGHDTHLLTIYPHALGLTEENKKEILPEVKAGLIDEIKKKITGRTTGAS